MSSNQFGLVEIVEVIRTSDQVEMVNRLENDAISTVVNTVVRELMGIHNSAAKHKDFSRIVVFNNSGNALFPNNRTNNSFNDSASHSSVMYMMPPSHKQHVLFS